MTTTTVPCPAAQVRALQDRVRRFRFRDADSYIEQMDELAADLGRLASELDGIAPRVVFATPVVAMTTKDGPRAVPAVVMSGRNQVIVSYARPANNAGVRVGNSPR